MKRLVGVATLAAGVLLLVPGSARAQGFGIKGGLLWSDFRDDPSASSYQRFGAFSVGAFVHLRLGALSVRPELLYSRRGAEASDGESGAFANQRFELDYLEAPVLIEVGSSPSFFFGPYGAVRVRSKLVTEVGGDRTELDVAANVEDFDYGAIVGIGLQFGKFGVEGRYVYGLRKLFKATGGDAAPGLKHRAVALLGSLNF